MHSRAIAGQFSVWKWTQVCLQLGCRYAADRISQTTGRQCNKQQYKGRNLTPGLFWIYCLDCSGCIGFLVMTASESPRTLFEALYTRWQIPPLVVVYDNSCHAQAFALNREAEWARTIQWVIDALHFKGHSGCAFSYDIKEFLPLQQKNSQLCEQQVLIARLILSKYSPPLSGQSYVCI